MRALFGFIQQVGQFDGATVAGLERTAVGAVHGAKAHVLQLHIRRYKAGFARHGKHLLEMQGLTLVDKVQHAIGMQLIMPITHGSQIGGGVQVTAAGLLHDHWQGLVFAVLEFIEEHALGALAFGQQACRAQIADDAGQFIVVGAFTAHIGLGQADAKAVVDGLAVAEGNLVEAIPQRQALGIAGLQLHHALTCTVGEVFAFIKALLCLAVEVLQIAQLGLGVYRVFFHIGQQHAELGAPVADVVLTDDGMAKKFQYAGHGIADDRGAQVANVHFLGQVGRGVIDYHALDFAYRAGIQLRVIQRALQLCGQPGAVLKEVDKAGAGDVYAGDGLMGGQGGNQFVSQVAWFHLRRFGQHHRQVAGKIAVRLVARGLHLNIGGDVGWQDALVLESLDGGGQKLADQVLHLMEYPAGAQ